MELVTSVDIDSKSIIVNIPNSSKYAVVTLDASNQPMYHVVDLSLSGYDPVGNMGEVISANNVIETYTGITKHGYTFQIRETVRWDKVGELVKQYALGLRLE